MVINWFRKGIKIYKYRWGHNHFESVFKEKQASVLKGAKSTTSLLLFFLAYVMIHNITIMIHATF